MFRVCGGGGGAPVTTAPTSVPLPNSLLEAVHLSLPVSLAIFYPRSWAPDAGGPILHCGASNGPPPLNTWDMSARPQEAFPNWNHQTVPSPPSLQGLPPISAQSSVAWSLVVEVQGCACRSAGQRLGRVRGGHGPPRREGTSRTPGGVVPKSRSRGAWLKGSGTCHRGLAKNKQWAEAPGKPVCPAPQGRGGTLRGPRTRAYFIWYRLLVPRWSMSWHRPAVTMAKASRSV